MPFYFIWTSRRHKVRPKELVTKRLFMILSLCPLNKRAPDQKRESAKVARIDASCKRLSCNLWENFYGGRPQPKLSIYGVLLA